MSETPPSSSMPDWRESEPAALQPVPQADLAQVESPLSTSPAQWKLAWEEFGLRWPRMKRGAALTNWLFFNGGGLSVLFLVSLIYGWLPLWAFVITLLATLTLSGLFIIRFAGLAHQRAQQELKNGFLNEIEQRESQIKTLQDAKQIKLTAFFLDIDSGLPYPYRMDRYGIFELQKREGVEIQAIVRILNEGIVETRVHNLSLIVEIEEAGEEERLRYVALHPEEKDGEQDAEFDLNGYLRLVSNHPESIVPKLGRYVVKKGRPLEGYVRFKVAGMYADGFPEHGPWSIYITLGADDDTGQRHFIPMQWGMPPRPAKQLEHGIHKSRNRG